jgi:hypothetical protein
MLFGGSRYRRRSWTIDELSILSLPLAEVYLTGAAKWYVSSNVIYSHLSHVLGTG